MPDSNPKDGSGSSRQIAGLPVVRRHVAGMDLGSERHWGCAPPADGAAREIADFGATTAELIRMGSGCQRANVESLAMESTGVYWIAPHEVLEAAGLEIMLVDTRQLAMVPGRDQKTDPTDHSLRMAARLVSARGGCVHVADAGTGQGEPGGGVGRRGAEDA